MDKDLNKNSIGDNMNDVHEVNLEITIETADCEDVETKPKMSAKRRAFIKQRDKRLSRNCFFLFAFVSICTTFIDNIAVACVLFTISITITIVFWGEWRIRCMPDDYGHTPWWYFGL